MRLRALQRLNPFSCQLWSPPSDNIVPSCGDREKGILKSTSEISIQSSSSSLQTLPLDLPVAGLKVRIVAPGYFEEDAPSEWSNPEWGDCCFIIVEVLPHYKDDSLPYFKLVVKSPYLTKICNTMMGSPLPAFSSYQHYELNPKQFIQILPKMKVYCDELSAKLHMHSKADKWEIKNLIATIEVVLNYYRKTYKKTLATIEELQSREEITFDLLFTIFPPGTIVLEEDPFSHEMRAFRTLFSPLPFSTEGEHTYYLRLEATDTSARDSSSFCTTVYVRSIPFFQGAVKISTLNIYPLIYHPHHNEIRKQLIEKGKKWAKLSIGIHHMYYQGADYSGRSLDITNSRVIIDGVNHFKYTNATFSSKFQNTMWKWHSPADTLKNDVPPVQYGVSDFDMQIEDLQEDDFLIARWALYGFSLTEKTWIQMNVSNVSEIEWNPDAFASLVISKNRKNLLQSLVEAQNEDLKLDDFVKSGLVVSLSGPPGVGKTYSIEATCERAKRPLLRIGASDLGVTTFEREAALQSSFQLASAWKAVILIDRAVAFFGRGNLIEWERNAMVTAFLHCLKYHPAIVFLGTNYAEDFDETFYSHIHVSLRFKELSPESLKIVWTSFLTKIGATIFNCSPAIDSQSGVFEEELEMLSQRRINGRQVKNSVKTALCLAVARGEPLRYSHLVEILDVEDSSD